MGLDDVVRAVFSSQLEVPSEKWSESYVDALVEGYLDAATNRDAPLVLASLRKSAADLVVAGRLKLVARDARRARCAPRASRERARTTQRLSAALDERALRRRDARALAPAPPSGAGPRFRSSSRSSRRCGLPSSRPRSRVLASAPPGPLRDALARFVERVLPGHEADVAQSLAGMDPNLAVRARRAPRARGDAGGQARARAARGERRRDAAHRSEGAPRIVGRPGSGRADAAPRERLRPRSDGGPARRHAARAQASLAGDRAAGPRRRTSTSSAPTSGESCCTRWSRSRLTAVSRSPLELVKKGGVFTSEDRETSRALAAEALGELLAARRSVAGRAPRGVADPVGDERRDARGRGRPRRSRSRRALGEDAAPS